MLHIVLSYLIILTAVVTDCGYKTPLDFIPCDVAAKAIEARREAETREAEKYYRRPDLVNARVFRFMESTPYIKTVGYTAYVDLYLINAYQNQSGLSGKSLYKAIRDLYKDNSFHPQCFVKIKSDSELPLPSELCCCPIPQIMCKHKDKKYRTFDGSCNCLEKPEMGRANKAFTRFLPPDYADGVSEPRASQSGNPLPSARKVSNLIYQAPGQILSEVLTVMHMAFGQILDHDTDRTPVSQFLDNSGDLVNIDCGNDGCDTSGPENEECFPIPVSPDDPTFGADHNCLKFVRSQAFLVAGCFVVPREQANLVTSWLDASFLYGSSVAENERIRDPNGGRGKMAQIPNPLHPTCKPLIPTQNDPACRGVTMDIKCFLAGDVRQNEQVGLTSLHIIFVRLHNFFEENLHAVNPHWNGERLFQETRKLVIAVWQNMVYKEFLPLLVGPDAMQNYKLKVGKGKSCTKVDCKDESGDTRNVFATAAFRFGHSLIPESLKLTDSSLAAEKLIPLPSLLFNPTEIYNTHFGDTCGVGAILLGLASQYTDQSDRYFSSSIRNHLFTDNPPAGLGTDLPALNTQRGRDHGIPGYNKWREFCGLQVATNFDDLVDIPEELREKFEELYEHVDDIDLYPAAMSETQVTGGIVGPTFACILSRQFRGFKIADRFWFERCSYFKKSQRQNIRQYSTGRLFCDTLTKVNKIQKYTMMKSKAEALNNFNIPKWQLYKWISLFRGENNKPKKCKEHPGINFELFRDPKRYG